jgi:hypothetical protein
VTLVMSVIFPTFPFFAPSRACVLPGDERHFGKQKKGEGKKGAGRRIIDITDITGGRQLNDVSRHYSVTPGPVIGENHPQSHAISYPTAASTFAETVPSTISRSPPYLKGLAAVREVATEMANPNQ